MNITCDLVLIRNWERSEVLIVPTVWRCVWMCEKSLDVTEKKLVNSKHQQQWSRQEMKDAGTEDRWFMLDKWSMWPRVRTQRHVCPGPEFYVLVYEDVLTLDALLHLFHWLNSFIFILSEQNIMWFYIKQESLGKNVNIDMQFALSVLEQCDNKKWEINDTI